LDQNECSSWARICISQAIPEPIANLSVQKPTVIDHSNQQDQTINKNLDILFKKEMEK
jgi:hypothetical protein